MAKAMATATATAMVMSIGMVMAMATVGMSDCVQGFEPCEWKGNGHQ
jgi:hypothetical protein